MHDSIGNIIARRRFSHTKGGCVDVCLNAPYSVGSDYRCDYTIKGHNFDRTGHAMGIDGIQAIYLSLRSIATDLYLSQDWKSEELFWIGGMSHGDLGLPIQETIRNIVEGKQ